MSMMNWSLSALARSWAIAGVAASALRHVEQRPIDLVHRHERRRPCRPRSGRSGGGPGPACRRDRRPWQAAAPRPRAAVRSADRDRIRRWRRSGSGSASGTGTIRTASVRQIRPRSDCCSWLFSLIAAFRIVSGSGGAKTSSALAASKPVPSDIARWCCTMQRTRLLNARRALLNLIYRSKTKKLRKHHDLFGEFAGAARRHQGCGSWPDRGDAGRHVACARGTGPPKAKSGAANTGRRRATFPCGCSASGWRAEGRRAVAAGRVLRARLLGHLAGVRPQRARQGRIFAS